MAGKARVSALAKELGVTSKEVLAKLSEMGEYVKSASSTVEAPVARQLREAFPDPPPRRRPAKKAPGQEGRAPRPPTGRRHPLRRSSRSAPGPGRTVPAAAPTAHRPAAPLAPAAAARAAAPAAPPAPAPAAPAPGPAAPPPARGPGPRIAQQPLRRRRQRAAPGPCRVPARPAGAAAAGPSGPALPGPAARGRTPA